MGMIIGIAGGKGGTGKSLISVALARMLSRNHGVMLVDADVECPNDHLILGVKKSQLREIERVRQLIPSFNTERCNKCGLCGNTCRRHAIVTVKNQHPVFIPEQCNGCGACIFVCPNNAISSASKIIGTIKLANVSDNLDLLMGELIIGEEESTPVVNSLKNKLLSELKERYEFVVVDTAAGIKCIVISALEIVDIALIVTEPTPFGIHDAKLTLQIINKLRVPYKLIINKATLGDAAAIYNLARKHDAEIIAHIPYDEELFVRYSRGMMDKLKELEDFAKRLCSTETIG